MQNVISRNSLVAVAVAAGKPKTVHFGGTYKFSIDLCQVCMPFFPFCIISAAAAGQIAAECSALAQGRSPKRDTAWHSKNVPAEAELALVNWWVVRDTLADKHNCCDSRRSTREVCTLRSLLSCLQQPHWP